MTRAELKAWRLARDLTQTQAAKIAGSGSYKTWQRWENGTRKVPHWLPATLREYDAHAREAEV